MSSQTIELLKTALEMEKKGKDFYDDAAKKCRNRLGREIFTTLARDEVVHVDRIKMIYESLNTGKAWTDEWLKISRAADPAEQVFDELAGKHKDMEKTERADLEAIDVGIGLEEKSVALYEKLGAQATDPMEKRFAQKMIAEENTHLKVLQDTKFYLTDPEAYFLEMEKAEFDAG